MGMAFPSISTYPADPVFQTLVAQGQTTEPEFAVKLAESGGQLTIGGVDASLFTGTVTYTPVTHEVRFKNVYKVFSGDLMSVYIGLLASRSG